MATSSSRLRPHDQVTVENDVLKIGDVNVTFNRTLRVPADGTTYPLPPGLGHFPVRRVQDFLGRVPAEWAKHGGVFLPMYQREAMWMQFWGPSTSSPRAVKVGVGKVCAVSGAPWSERLQGGGREQRQDYVVVPTQKFLDGIKAGDETVRQFVAMPLGMGYTVEAQVTGEERHGGVQVCVFRPKPGWFPDQAPSFGGRRGVLHSTTEQWPPGPGVHWAGSGAAFGAAATALIGGGGTSNWGAPAQHKQQPPPSVFGYYEQAAAAPAPPALGAAKAASLGAGSGHGPARHRGYTVAFDCARSDSDPPAPRRVAVAVEVDSASPIPAATPASAAPAATPAAPAAAAAATPPPRAPAPGGAEMGVAAGGLLRQEVYADPHGVDVWEQPACARVFVHLCNSAMWRDVTGEAPPETPVSARTYARHGLPWFDVYDEGQVGVDAAPALAAVKSVKEMDAAKGFAPQQDDEPVAVPPWNVHMLKYKPTSVVFDGVW